MTDFLFKKDLWILDLITSLGISFLIGYLTLANSLTGERNWAGILFGTAAYLITFVLAFHFQGKYRQIRSWMWLGIVGAFVRIILLEAIHFPRLLDYHRRFTLSFLEGIENISPDILKVIFFNWLLYAVIGLIFIFATRILYFVFFKTLNSWRWQESRIEKNSE